MRLCKPVSGLISSQSHERYYNNITPLYNNGVQYIYITWQSLTTRFPVRRRSSDSFQLVWVRSRDRYDVEQRRKWDESQQGRLRQLRDADDRVPVQRPVAQDDRQVARAGDAVDHQRAPRLQQRRRTSLTNLSVHETVCYTLVDLLTRHQYPYCQ